MISNQGHEEMKEIGIPVVTLSNKVRVANFAFFQIKEFEDGTILPGIPMERAMALAIDSNTTEIRTLLRSGMTVVDVTMAWTLTPTVKFELNRLSKYNDYDILLVPSAVMYAIKESNFPIHRCRTGINTDNEKTLRIDKFRI